MYNWSQSLCLKSGTSRKCGCKFPITSTIAFIAETNPSEEVLKVLKESCFDCHSNKTNYPWYNNITPVNFWLAAHVKDGKKHLNFST